MAGQMGAVRSTTQNIEVVSVDDDEGVVLLCGAVPGTKEWLGFDQRCNKGCKT